MVVTLVARTDTRITGLARYAYGLYATFQASGQAVRLVALRCRRCRGRSSRC
ncbi:MAG: hypothetical protein HC884_15300 [Chloroflexaceae bacterium]|nr:hypothetical protein [Chloroflexaceae bacterium]